MGLTIDRLDGRTSPVLTQLQHVYVLITAIDMKAPPESDEYSTVRLSLECASHHHVLMGACSLVIPVSKTGRSIVKKNGCLP